MKTITICLEKGGVGKTLIARELAVGLAVKHHQRVLNCDMDPQGNLTKAQLKMNDPLTISTCSKVIEQFKQGDQSISTASLLLKKYFVESAVPYDMSDVLKEPANIQKAILHTDIKGLDIIPASHRLTESDIQLKTNVQSSPCMKLTRALKQVEHDYDFVIVDNPPFTNALLYNSVYACRNKDDLIIIPISIDSGGLEGLYTTLNDLIETANEGMLDFDFKILPVMVQGNNEDRSAIHMLHQIFPNRVLHSHIRFQGKPIKKASLNRYSLVNHDFNSRHGVSDDLRKLVDEIWNLSKEGN